MTTAIELRQLRKVYELRSGLSKRRVVALEGLDLTLSDGQIFGLLGPNGAGKSTTIKLLLNIIQPTQGSAHLFGHPPSSVEARRLVGYLPENPAPYEYLTGQEFVEYAGRLSGLTGSALKRRVDAVIEQVQMGQARGLQIRRYSKGMIQRISLAQALVAEPRVLILDEPTSGLDVLGRQLIRDIILAERKRGTTVLFCSHIIPDVEALCDRVAVLIGGKLVREGAVSDLLRGETNEVELVIEGASAEVETAVRALGAACERSGTTLQVRTEEGRVPELLKVVVEGKATIGSLQRARYSLETLFLADVRGSDRKVGGVIE